ncbi:MAG: ROK family protein [Candidatus Aminicenantaceae bacterium]
MSLYAGFDLGGTYLKYGLVDEKGIILFKEKAPSPAAIEALLNLINKLWEEIKRKGKEEVKAVGFGFPGIFNIKEQKTYQSPNYPSLDNFELQPALARFIEVPFWIDNDANMAAYGEFKAGGGKGVQIMVLLTIGTGVGSGIILDGKIYHGKCGFAAELGHVIVNHEGTQCKCGSYGCLETEVSAPKIVKNYNSLAKTKENISAEEVYRRARRGDGAARQAFARAGYYLGIGLASVINFLNPEKILLGGGVMSTGDYLFSPALEETRRRSYRASFECCSIEKAILGNDAGIIGSALLAKHNLVSQL